MWGTNHRAKISVHQSPITCQFMNNAGLIWQCTHTIVMIRIAQISSKAAMHFQYQRLRHILCIFPRHFLPVWQRNTSIWWACHSLFDTPVPESKQKQTIVVFLDPWQKRLHFFVVAWILLLYILINCIFNVFFLQRFFSWHTRTVWLTFRTHLLSLSIKERKFSEIFSIPC